MNTFDLQKNNSNSRYSNDEQPSLSDEHPLLRLKGYTALSSIGHGSQGKLLSAIAPDGQKVAIKCFDLRTISDWKEEELFRREVETLKNLNVPGTPRFIDELESDSTIYLIESFINAPSLETRLRQGFRYSFEQVLTIYKNAAVILNNLQSPVQPIIHRDIKPANILVAEDLSVSIVDFGVVASKIQLTNAMTFAGTAGYVAPEQLYGKVTAAADIFSLGATMLHLLTGIAPCDMEMDGITPDIDRYLPIGTPDWFTKILKDSLAPDPKVRISNASQLLERLNAGNIRPQSARVPKLNKAANVPAKKPEQCNKIVSLLLCIFLGGFGIHRFYEGKIFTGILYAMSFGFFGFGVFIDFILILLKPMHYPKK